MEKIKYKKWLYWGAVVLIGILVFVVGYAISKKTQDDKNSSIINNKSAVPSLPTY